MPTYTACVLDVRREDVEFLATYRDPNRSRGGSDPLGRNPRFCYVHKLFHSRNQADDPVFTSEPGEPLLEEGDALRALEEAAAEMISTGEWVQSERIRTTIVLVPKHIAERRMN